MKSDELEQSLKKLEQPEPSPQLDASILGGIKQLMALENYQKAEQLLLEEGGRLTQATRAQLASGMAGIREQIGPGFQEAYQAYQQTQQPAPEKGDELQP
jgi:hypothetical protein